MNTNTSLWYFQLNLPTTCSPLGNLLQFSWIMRVRPSLLKSISAWVVYWGKLGNQTCPTCNTQGNWLPSGLQESCETLFVSTTTIHTREPLVHPISTVCASLPESHNHTFIKLFPDHLWLLSSLLVDSQWLHAVSELYLIGLSGGTVGFTYGRGNTQKEGMQLNHFKRAETCLESLANCQMNNTLHSHSLRASMLAYVSSKPQLPGI